MEYLLFPYDIVFSYISVIFYIYVFFSVICRSVSWMYQRLAKSYGGACNPNSSVETDDTEAAPQIMIPSFTYDSKSNHVFQPN